MGQSFPGDHDIAGISDPVCVTMAGHRPLNFGACMKIFFSLTLLAFLSIFHFQAFAQALSANATKEQIVEALGIRKDVPPENLMYLLCFGREDRKKFRSVRFEKIVNFLGALEDAGVKLDDAFANTDCGLDGKRPLTNIFSFSGSPFTNLQEVMVRALATHADRTGKRADWLLGIVLLKDKSGETLYSLREAYGRSTIREIPQQERAFREYLATFSTHEIALFGRDGSDFDMDYFRSSYKIDDVDNFLGHCVSLFLNAERRAKWLELARKSARGEFHPRGMEQNMDLESMQNCMKVPDMEAKMREVSPAFGRRSDLRHLKKRVMDSFALLTEVRDSQLNLCPPGVSILVHIPFCTAQYELVYKKLQNMVDNEKSGLTIAELDKVQ